MLNRRYLRIKAYQSLYAFWQGDEASAARIEKELLLSIDRTFDLYVALMLTFGELRHAAELRMEERRSKRLPSPEDLSPNRRFVDGPLLNAIIGSPMLKAEATRRRVDWTGDLEIFQKLLKVLTADEVYARYMAAGSISAREEQNFLAHVFLEHIAHFEPLHDLFETRSIYWLEDLDLACALVKRTLEQARSPEQLEEAVRGTMTQHQEEREFVSMLFRRTIELRTEHEAAIAAKASNWELDRIAVSDMILMEMALTEARTFEQIPLKVSLNEYIEIAKAYSTPKSKNFINGILDRLFLEMKEEGRIKKVGRGLLEN
ncbi:MAG: transcription antitermination protein NusB [Flavobacteriales bacterium]|nr:transcription antitermination protein NusB [Flavobacteriales bacterium]MCB9168184.1 transcription antitermination protein NusB [Flavobacteriales bacterium]MCB9194251.1 transcription antitermination protein NusB [Flavobacteriales bacterium]